MDRDKVIKLFAINLVDAAIMIAATGKPKIGVEPIADVLDEILDRAYEELNLTFERAING